MDRGSKVLTSADVEAVRSKYSEVICQPPRSGLCVVWAGLLLAYLRNEKSMLAMIVGGSASFPCSDDLSKIPPPLPTHGTYRWDTETAKIHTANGVMPEVHAWVVVKHEDTLWEVDLSVKYIPSFFHEVMAKQGVDWTWEAPEAIDRMVGSGLLTGSDVHYTPSLEATKCVVRAYTGAQDDYPKLPDIGGIGYV